MTDYEKQLDNILFEIGDFGKYQQRVLVLLMLVMGTVFFSNIMFIFEAKPINHRCLIPECENETSVYSPNWLTEAIPFKGDKPERCIRYRRLNNDNFSCLFSDFNQSIKEDCHEFKYETTEISIMQDFDLHCDDNMKKLTFVGTTNGIGKFIGLPIAGYTADRYGRKKTLVWSMLISGLFGLSRSFSTNYNVFIVFQFLDSLFISGAYVSVYVLAAELVGPKKRVLSSTLLNLSYGLGSLLFANLVWTIQIWRIYLRVIYGIIALGIVCNWLIPESLRWLLIRKKSEDVKALLTKIADINGKSVDCSSLQRLSDNENDHSETTYPLHEFLKSHKLMIRLACCSFCWISCVFTYYGLALTVVTLSKSSYLDFILSCVIELPACLTSYLLIDRMGRRLTLFIGYSLSSIFSVVLIFIPTNIYSINIALFLLGKYGISITMYSIYMITSELFPTPLRQTIVSLCSMFGRIGNIAVPQLLLLKEIWNPSPFALFAIFTGISALLSIIFPETKNTVLPDTVKEAENIGSKKINYIDIN